MTTTRKTVRQVVQRKTGTIYILDTTTNVAGSSPDVIATTLENVFRSDDDCNNHMFWMSTATNANVERVVENYVSSTSILTMTGADLLAEEASAEFEISSGFTPTEVHNALEDTLNADFQHVHDEVEDTTLFTHPNQTVFSKPSAVRVIQEISIENHLNPCFDENILHQEGYDVEFESLDTTGVTDTNVTCAVYGSTDQKKQFVPDQYKDYLLQVISSSSAGSRSYSISNPAYYKGQKLTMVMPIYCETASEFTIRITDSAGNTTSSAHGGTGWEQLTVSHAIDDSASSLAISIEAAGNTVVGFVGEMILTRSEYYTSNYWRRLEGWTIFNDTIRFKLMPTAGRFLRVSGTIPITNPTSDSGTVALDSPQVDLLYAGIIKRLWEMRVSQHASDPNNPYLSVYRIASGRKKELEKLYSMPPKPVTKTRQI